MAISKKDKEIIDEILNNPSIEEKEKASAEEQPKKAPSKKEGGTRLS